MKKLVLLSILAAGMPAGLWAQDDMYFVPTKELAEQTAREYGMPRETYYIGSTRSIDEYNRRGSMIEELDSLGNDSIRFDAVVGVYPDSTALEEPDDYRYTRRMNRFDGYEPSSEYWAGYYAGRYSWHSPWYYGSLGYYPWYTGYYDYYYGYYDPWYYDYYGWYSPWRYSWYGGYYSPWYYGGWYRPAYTVVHYDTHHHAHHSTASRGIRSHGTVRYSNGTFGGNAVRRNGTFGNTRTRTTTTQTPRSTRSEGYTPRTTTTTTNSYGNFGGARSSGSFGGSGTRSGGGSFGGGGTRSGGGGGGGGRFGRH